jgi:hypothetical protein
MDKCKSCILNGAMFPSQYMSEEQSIEACSNLCEDFEYDESDMNVYGYYEVYCKKEQ